MAINQAVIRMYGTVVLTLPATPPIAWVAKISRVSSYPRANLSWVAKLQTVPATTPKTREAAAWESKFVNERYMIGPFPITHENQRNQKLG